ncbi:MAG: hypothetical protein AB3N18_09630 [Allomuricauda sp.]
MPRKTIKALSIIDPLKWLGWALGFQGWRAKTKVGFVFHPVKKTKGTDFRSFDE